MSQVESRWIWLNQVNKVMNIATEYHLATDRMIWCTDESQAIANGACLQKLVWSFYRNACTPLSINFLLHKQ